MGLAPLRFYWLPTYEQLICHPAPQRPLRHCYTISYETKRQRKINEIAASLWYLEKEVHLGGESIAYKEKAGKGRDLFPAKNIFFSLKTNT
jgi:hypothetical protein